MCVGTRLATWRYAGSALADIIVSASLESCCIQQATNRIDAFNCEIGNSRHSIVFKPVSNFRHETIERHRKAWLELASSQCEAPLWRFQRDTRTWAAAVEGCNAYYGERYHRSTHVVRSLSFFLWLLIHKQLRPQPHMTVPAAHKHVPQLQNRETKDKQNRTKMVSHNALLFIHLRCLYATQETSRSSPIWLVSTTTISQLVTAERVQLQGLLSATIALLSPTPLA